MVIAVVAGLFWSLAADNRYVGVFSTLAVMSGVSTILTTWWFSRHA